MTSEIDVKGNWDPEENDNVREDTVATLRGARGKYRNPQ